MDTTSLFTALFQHMEWADALIWHSVLRSPPATRDQTIRKRLHHIHLCQRAWLRIWLTQSIDPHAGESMSLTDLASWAREYHHDVARYLLQVQESDLDERIAMPGVGKQSQQPSLWETLLQITAHSTYHRGQVGSRLREIGGEPPQTDFINWVILGKPNAEWPSETEVEEAAEG